jgi:nucleoside-diphosphate-sugar epimerase
LIHLSGTGILSDFKDTKEYRGRLNPKVYSDIDSIDDITSRPAGSLHRHTDLLIQETADKHGDKFKAAIVCPPDIYGRGHGPGRNQSVYFPQFIKESRKIGAPFYTNEGSNTRGWVHIDDVMGLYVPLVEAAVAGGGSATWGRQVSQAVENLTSGCCTDNISTRGTSSAPRKKHRRKT